jgi:hypothetical protein
LLLVENEPKDIQIAADAAGLFRQLIGNDTPFHLNGHRRHSAEFAIDGRTLQLSVSKVSADGAGAEKILILTDFTDRKLAEYAVRTAEKISKCRQSTAPTRG